MVTSLFQHGRIQTTDAKAKELRRWADQMVTLAKRGDLHARRQALAVMRDKAVVHRLFEEAADLFGDRMGGYTHVVKLGRRRGDAAPLSLVELVTAQEKKDRKKKKSKATKKALAKAEEKLEPKKAEPAKKVEEKAAPEAKEETIAEAKGEGNAEQAETESSEPTHGKEHKEKE